MAALSTADALKRIPAPAWDIGERPTTAQAYITLPPYTCEKEDIVCQRSADGAYMSQAGRDRIRHATANSRREQQRRQGNGFCSSLHKATLDYRTVDHLGVTPDVLVVGRKPSAQPPTLQIVRPTHQAQIIEGRSLPATTLFPGKEVAGQVVQYSFKYYKVIVPHKNIALKLTLNSISGDPDIFVCNRHANPNQQNFTWKSAGMGSDEVYIPPDDPWAFPGAYYIGVYGAYDTEFTILATFIRIRVLVKHPSGLDVDDGVELMREEIKAADLRRQLCRYGAGFLEQLEVPRGGAPSSPRAQSPRGGDPSRASTARAAQTAKADAVSSRLSHAPSASTSPSDLRADDAHAQDHHCGDYAQDERSSACGLQDESETYAFASLQSGLHRPAIRPSRFVVQPASPRATLPPSSTSYMRAQTSSPVRGASASTRSPSLRRRTSFFGEASRSEPSRTGATTTAQSSPKISHILSIDDFPSSSKSRRDPTARAPSPSLRAFVLQNHMRPPRGCNAIPSSRSVPRDDGLDVLQTSGAASPRNFRGTTVGPARHYSFDGTAAAPPVLRRETRALDDKSTPPLEGAGVRIMSGSDSKEEHASQDIVREYLVPPNEVDGARAKTDSQSAGLVEDPGGVDSKRRRTGSGALLVPEEQKTAMLEEILRVASPRRRWSQDVRAPSVDAVVAKAERLANLIRPQEEPVHVRAPGDFEEELRAIVHLPSKVRQERLAAAKAADAGAASGIVNEEEPLLRGKAPASKLSQRLSGKAPSLTSIPGTKDERGNGQPQHVQIPPNTNQSTEEAVRATNREIVADILMKAAHRRHSDASTISRLPSANSKAASAAVGTNGLLSPKLKGGATPRRRASLHKIAQKDIATKYGMTPSEFAARTGIPVGELVELERGEFHRLKQLMKGVLEESLDLQEDLRQTMYRFRSKAVQHLDSTARSNIGWKEAVAPLVRSEAQKLMSAYERAVVAAQADFEAQEFRDSEHTLSQPPGDNCRSGDHAAAGKRSPTAHGQHEYATDAAHALRRLAVQPSETAFASLANGTHVKGRSAMAC